MRDLPTPTPPLVSNPFESHRRLPRAAETVTAQHRLQVAWARTDEELREAQRLRYRVFAEEMGARLTGPAGLDVDTFDHYCDHLLVRDLDTLKVVGTYRVHPDYRSGSVIMSLWGGLGAYMTYNGYETMLGCASVAMADGGHYAANLYCSLDASALTDPEYRAFPHTPLPVDELRTGTTAVPPPLIKGYLRLGAKICGAPAWDPDFNTADFLTLFRLSEINARYARHFLADA